MKALVLCSLMAVAQHLAAQETQPQGNRTPADSAVPEPAKASAEKTSKEVPNPHEFSPGIGTTIVAELTNAVNAKKAKSGDRVECTVVADLLFHGKIVIPRNAKVIGHITEAAALTKDQHQSRLGLTFEKVLLKDRKEFMFEGPAIVVALAPPVIQTVRTTTDVRDMPVQMDKGGQASAGGSSGGSTTGSSLLNAVTTNPNLLGGNMASHGVALGATDRGVIGWPGLYLLKGSPGTSIVASPKNTVELGFQTQVVLLVVEAHK
jgi:hypothetical protein